LIWLVTLAAAVWIIFFILSRLNPSPALACVVRFLDPCVTAVGAYRVDSRYRIMVGYIQKLVENKDAATLAGIAKALQISVPPKQ
jgi:hypothetical protein